MTKPVNIAVLQAPKQRGFAAVPALALFLPLPFKTSGAVAVVGPVTGAVEAGITCCSSLASCQTVERKEIQLEVSVARRLRLAAISLFYPICPL